MEGDTIIEVPVSGAPVPQEPVYQYQSIASFKIPDAMLKVTDSFGHTLFAEAEIVGIVGSAQTAGLAFIFEFIHSSASTFKLLSQLLEIENIGIDTN